MRAKLLEYLSILNIAIAANEDYLVLYQLTTKVKNEHGSSFKYYTEEGLPNFLLTLEELSIPINRDNKVVRNINMFKTLEMLTNDFSVLSGLSNSQWELLILYLTKSNLRIYSPELIEGKLTFPIPVSSLTPAKQPAITDISNLLLKSPWAITLLLLEVLPVYRPPE